MPIINVGFRVLSQGLYIFMKPLNRMDLALNKNKGKQRQINKNEEEEKGNPAPIVTNYIAESFLKICEGLSHRPNFIRYTYREEMVMDAVENCLKAISNYNLETATRTGKPNAFSYFTQIAFFAFLRRIAKEKKQQDVKFRFIERMSVEDFVDVGISGSTINSNAESYIDTLRQRISSVRENDKRLDEYAKKEKAKKAPTKLELFMS